MFSKKKKKTLTQLVCLIYPSDSLEIVSENPILSKEKKKKKKKCFDVLTSPITYHPPDHYTLASCNSP